MSHASSSPPAEAWEAWVPPEARTVAIRASAVPRISYRAGSAPRSEPQYTARALAPFASICSQRVSTKAVFPERWCAR